MPVAPSPTVQVLYHLPSSGRCQGATLVAVYSKSQIKGHLSSFLPLGWKECILLLVGNRRWPITSPRFPGKPSETETIPAMNYLKKICYTVVYQRHIKTLITLTSSIKSGQLLVGSFEVITIWQGGIEVKSQPQRNQNPAFCCMGLLVGQCAYEWLWTLAMAGTFLLPPNPFLTKEGALDSVELPRGISNVAVK